MIRNQLIAMTLLISVITSLGSFSVFADVLTLRDNAPQKYVVKKGDTLWDISGAFLKKPWRWPELWRKNEFINNPHLIFPGDVLHLLFDAKGRPYLAKAEKRKVSLSPHAQVSLKELRSKSSAIPAVSLHMLSPYLTNYYIVSANKMREFKETAATVMGMQTGFDRGTQAHTAYAIGEIASKQQLAVIHVDEPITAYGSDDVLGYEIRVAAIGVLNEPATDGSDLQGIQLQTVKREVLQGDLIIPLSSLAGFSSVYHLQAASVDVVANIVKVGTKGLEIGKYDIVVIDSGINAGLKNGDVLFINRESSMMFNTNPPRYAQQLPAKDTVLGRWVDELFIGKPHTKTIQLGEILILQAKPELSLAIVLNTKMPMKVGDRVESAIPNLY